MNVAAILLDRQGSTAREPESAAILIDLQGSGSVAGTHGLDTSLADHWSTGAMCGTLPRSAAHARQLTLYVAGGTIPVR
jgi:hypothetical protein